MFKMQNLAFFFSQRDSAAAATAWFGLASARPKRQSQPRNLVIGWISA
jgi:hypothetical protein